MTRTEWLAQLRGPDRVTLQDFILTAQAYASMPPATPDEPFVFLAFLEELARGIRGKVEPEEPIEPTPVPSTDPTTEEVLS